MLKKCIGEKNSKEKEKKFNRGVEITPDHQARLNEVIDCMMLDKTFEPLSDGAIEALIDYDRLLNDNDVNSF